MAFTNLTKNTASYTNQSRNTSSFSELTRNTDSYTEQSKSTNFWDMEGTDLLLLESGFLLLLETTIGLKDNIILEDSGAITSSWANLSKN